MIFKIKSMSQKFNHFLSISQWCFCTSLIKIHLLIQEIECRQCSFYSLYSVVTLKITSWSPKSNQIFLTIPIIQCTKFGQNLSFGLRDRVQTSCFGSKFDIQSGGVTLKMRSRSPKSNHSFLCPTGVYMQDWSKSTYWFRR